MSRKNPYDISFAVGSHMNPTQKAICNEYLRQYAAIGPDRISIKGLSAAIPIARTTFYTYYDNIGELKEDIENSFVAAIMENTKVIYTGSFEKTISRESAHALAAYFDENREVLSTFLLKRPNPDFTRKWTIALKYDLYEFFRHHGTRKEIDFPLEILASAIITTYTYYIRQPDAIDIDKSIDTLRGLLAKMGLL